MRLREVVFDGCALWFALTWTAMFAYMLVTEHHSITLWEGNMPVLVAELVLAVAVTAWSIMRLARRFNA